MRRAGARSEGLPGQSEELKSNSNTEGISKGILTDGAEGVSKEVLSAATRLEVKEAAHITRTCPALLHSAGW